jgi:hypothetical protein
VAVHVAQFAGSFVGVVGGVMLGVAVAAVPEPAEAPRSPPALLNTARKIASAGIAVRVAACQTFIGSTFG